MAAGSMHEGLYRLDKEVKYSYNKVNQVVSNLQTVLWHSRLRHLSSNKLTHLPTGVKHNAYEYDIFPLAKQYRLCFTKSKINTNKVFHFIHIDL